MEKILEQAYLTPQDIKKIIPTLSIEKCREIIELARIEMQNKGYFVPDTKPRIALTKIVRKQLGI